MGVADHAVDLDFCGEAAGGCDGGDVQTVVTAIVTDVVSLFAGDLSPVWGVYGDGDASYVVGCEEDG